MRQEQNPFFAVLQAVVEKNYSPEFIEKMMALAERNEAREAKRAYHEAMATFKENSLEIKKDKHVKYTTKEGRVVEYNHVTLFNVMKILTPELSKHGFSVSWRTEQKEGQVIVTCKITHKAGHSEETSLSSLPDSSGGKNSIQAVGSVVEYLKRYTFLALIGYSAEDMDDDGKGSEIKYISEEETAEITKIISAKNLDKARFLKYMGVESVDKIESKDLSKANNALKTAKGRPSDAN
jgi:hypothetical protein